MNCTESVAIAIAAAALTIYLVMAPRFAKSWLYHKRIFENKDATPCRCDLLAEFNAGEIGRFFRAEDGSQLQGCFFANLDLSNAADPGTNAEVILYCIGRASCITNCLENVKMLIESGYSVFIFDYRGFGGSKADSKQARKRVPSIESICADGVTAFDYLTNDLGFSADRVTIYGESLGAAVAAHITTQRPVHGLILQSGFASLKRIGQDLMPMLKAYPQLLYPSFNLDTEAILRRSHYPLLILHGVKDEVIPHAHAHVLFRAAAGAKRLVALPNSMHRCLWQTDRVNYIEAVIAFRQSLLKKEDCMSA